MPETETPRVAIVGGGPAGLMAAETIAAGAHGRGMAIAVTVYDRMPTLGRKLLIAGRGGLNLTHSEEMPRFLSRYGAREDALRAAVEAFAPGAARSWAGSLGQETFVGSSGRVFPRAMKASPLLRAWLRRLAELGVSFSVRHRWEGWDETGGLLFATPSGRLTATADACVLALGGASWPRLGSDGSWVGLLHDAGLAITPLAPANCGVLVAWSQVFGSRFQGQPLKRIAIAHGQHTVRGEAIVTASGLEGGAIYALSARLREAIMRDGEARIAIDLRPDLAHAELLRMLEAPRRKQSLASFLRKAAHMSPVAIGLLQEVAHATARPLGTMPAADLATLVKAVPLRLVDMAPIEKAISTAGGVDFTEVDAFYMLKKRPGTFVAGEMLDWEAPTGGYLLQACLATGAAAGRGVVRWLEMGRGRSPRHGDC